MAPKGKEKDSDLQQQDKLQVCSRTSFAVVCDAPLAHSFRRTCLQAVVLADSFASNFRPITFSMPKVLMPLANVPMLEYTLECLAAGGVQEIFIFCCAHADKVEEYIKESDLARRLASVKLKVLLSQAPCYSAGDALREVEARGVIVSDFVLVPGDVVANVALGPLITAHKVSRIAHAHTIARRLLPAPT